MPLGYSSKDINYHQLELIQYVPDLHTEETGDRNCPAFFKSLVRIKIRYLSSISRKLKSVVVGVVIGA